MTMKPKRENNLQGDYTEKASNKRMQEQLKKMMMKRKQPHEDGRYEDMTVNKVRQAQRREYTVGRMVASAKQKKAFGMALSPEEAWVMGNRHLFL